MALICSHLRRAIVPCAHLPEALTWMVFLLDFELSGILAKLAWLAG